MSATRLLSPPRIRTDVKQIQFSRTDAVGREHDYIREVVASGILAGDGRFGRACEALLQEIFSVPAAQLTTSCTHALEMAAMMLDCGPGDEIVMPSYTFVSTANAFVLRGAQPVFVDVDPITLQLDLEAVDRAVTPRTRAVVAVHYAGNSCDMRRLTALCDSLGIALVEDAAQAIGASFDGRPLGGFGRFATVSFHSTKNLGCGEGGALLLRDPEDEQRAAVIREKGTNRRAFFAGEVDKYTWVDVGSSYVLSELQAAFLLAQLERLREIQSRRRQIVRAYDDGLAVLCDAKKVSRLTTPAANSGNAHMYPLFLPTRAARDAAIGALRQDGIHAPFHYIPLHLSDMGRTFGYRSGDFPVSERVSETILRLPLHNTLTDADCQRVIAAVNRVLHAL